MRDNLTVTPATTEWAEESTEKGYAKLYARVVVNALSEYANGKDVDENMAFLLGCCNKPKNKLAIKRLLKRIDTGELKPLFTNVNQPGIITRAAEFLERTTKS